jgi:sugar phosphate isomerase/epimerase
MKYSFMSFSCPTLTFPQILEAARRFGYEGVEPRIVCGHAHGVELESRAEARRQIRAQASDAGIAIACVATSCTYADPAGTAKQIEDTRKSVELAADIGAPCIRVFGGTIAKGLSREDAVRLVADSLTQVADHARQHGVTICMETHDDWCDPNHVAAVVRRVAHPAIAVNWDIMHPVRRGNATMDSAFVALKPWIRHLHVHDGLDVGTQLKMVPIGTGAIDHRRAIQLLREIGYSGFISGEWIGWEDAYDVHLPREVAILRGYETQAD